MADRTVRTIFEAVTDRAQRNLTDLGKKAQDAGKNADALTKDLKTLDGLSVTPEVDVKIDAAERELADLKLTLVDLKGMTASPEVDVEIAETERKINDVRASLNELKGSKIEARLDVATKDAEKRLAQVKADLGELRTMEATPEVRADITAAQKNLREVQAELRELRGAKAQLTVTADTSQVDSAFDGLADAGDDVGDDIGGGMVSGILGALQSIPIAGAVVGVGAAIAGGLILGIQQGLAIEAERDLFSARTGLDEATSARFGRAAGEAYANAWGDSVAENLDTARIALQNGLIDEDAAAADIQTVIESLSGLRDIMGVDIPEAARAAGVMIRAGIADNAERAFDTLLAGYQNGANASDDLIDTMTEYPALFARLGLSADEATGLLVQGMEAGARNSDLAADALKEFQIRATDGSKLSAEGFAAIGLSAEEMTAKIAAGGAGAKEGLDQVLDGLRAMEDPVARNTAGVALFGTQWEDLGDAILALDVTTAVEALGSIEGSAGTAERALATLSDNTAAQMESARRNVELAADGIKGALAAAFSDEIEGAAEWVARNRAPILEFFIDVFNGAIDAGKGFAEFGATALDAIAGIADGMAALVDAIPGGNDLAESLRGVGESARESADTVRTEIPAALDKVADKFNTWAGPEVMAARVHDATLAMTNDFDAFMENVNTAEGTVTINGNQIPAEEVLGILVDNINTEDGTVTINGNDVPAQDALDVLLGLINDAEEDVTIGGDTKTGQERLADLRAQVKAAEDNIKINGDTEKGRQRLAELQQAVKDTEAAMKVSADTAQAEREITYLARGRTVTVRVVTQGSVGGGVPLHDGGWVKGLAAGGWVPGRDPGYDNVLWPLHSGGQTLTQPLTGGEYVVASGPAGENAALLEFLNAGGKLRAAEAAAASLDPAAIRAALEGTTITLTGVDYLANATSARITRAVRAGV